MNCFRCHQDIGPLLIGAALECEKCGSIHLLDPHEGPCLGVDHVPASAVVDTPVVEELRTYRVKDSEGALAYKVRAASVEEALKLFNQAMMLWTVKPAFKALSIATDQEKWKVWLTYDPVFDKWRFSTNSSGIFPERSFL